MPEHGNSSPDKKRKVMILTHGLYPVPGYSVSGNGIRAWGLAMGLVYHGLEVIYATPADTVHPHTPRPEVTLTPFVDKAELHRLITLHEPDVLVVGYWAYMHLIPNEIDLPLVMDLLAPWMLEAGFQKGGGMRIDPADYLGCLARGDHYLCCTQRQKAFHTAWLFMGGVIGETYPIDVVPISADPELPNRPASSHDRTVTFLYGGVLWPWRSPEVWIMTLLDTLLNNGDEGGVLQLIVGSYPLQKQAHSEPLFFSDDGRYNTVLKRSGLLAYDEMEQVFLQADIGIELSSQNCERELSFSFRVIEYLRCGLPVICNDFLEVAEWIKRYDAGWVIDSSDNDAFRHLIQRILSGDEAVELKRENAKRLVREQFNWLETVRPLVRFCENPQKRKVSDTPCPSIKDTHQMVHALQVEKDSLIERWGASDQMLESCRAELLLWQKIAHERRLSTRVKALRDRVYKKFFYKGHIRSPDTIKRERTGTTDYERFHIKITDDENSVRLGRVKKGVQGLYDGIRCCYRAVVHRLMIPLWSRRGKRNLAIVTRSDIFPVDHGAAAKIYHTARVLSFEYDEVYLITFDREKFFVFNDGKMHEETYPRLIRDLCYPGEAGLRKKTTTLGVPNDDAFLFFPKFDENFKLRVLYVALQKSIKIYQAEFPSFIDACSLAHRIFGGKRSIVEHNIEFHRISETYGLSDDVKNRMCTYEVELCNRVDHVVVVSQNDRKGLIEAGVLDEKITMIPHGVDLENFETDLQSENSNRVSIRGQYGISEDEIVLIFHGIFSYPPNGDAARLLGSRILPTLNAKGYRPKCLAVGKYPPEESNHPDLIYTDVVPHVAPYINAADIAVVPLQDGGGTRMKILEYFAAGIPVVASSKGAEGIEVTSGNEIIIEDDMGRFIEAVIDLMENRHRRQAIGDAGRNFVEALDWRKIGKAYAALYSTSREKNIWHR